MFYTLNKQYKLFILLLVIPLFFNPLFSQEKATTFFGPFYRANQFLPLVVHQHDDFNAIWIENKYSKDMLIFNQDKKAEALVKILPDGTLFELKDKKEEKKLLRFSFRILPEEVPLIIIASDKNQVQETSKDQIKIYETNILPSFTASYQMIEVLLIKDSYQDALTSLQSEAIKEWVLAGGIIIFESKNTLKKHAGLAVPLLKLANSNHFATTNNENMMENLSNEVVKISQHSIITSTGYGYIGIKEFQPNNFQEDLIKYCDDRISWRIRNRNNSLSEKNSLKNEISSTKVLLTQKITIIYFLLFMIFLFLKTTKYLTKIACTLGTASILPLVLLTPTNQLDAHYYQLQEKKDTIDYALLREEIYLRRGNTPEINIEIDNFSPYFVMENATIILQKNIRGQYIKQSIKSPQEYVVLKKTYLTKKLSFEKLQKDGQSFFYHKFPLDNIYLVSETNVNSLEFNIATSNQEGMITKLSKSKEEKLRDNYEKKLWYATSNQIFNSQNPPPESFIVLEGTTRLIPLEISPNLTIQKSFFTVIVVPEKK